MITVIIFATLATLILLIFIIRRIKNLKNEEYYSKTRCENPLSQIIKDLFFEIFFFLYLTIAIGFLIGFSIANILPMKLIEKQVYSVELVSIQDEMGISGKFFLGSGHINGKMQYVFYYKEGEFFCMRQVDYNLAKIKYTNSTPVFKIIKNVPTDDWHNLFALRPSKLCKEKYIFEIPEGSIKVNFNLDAQ